MNHKTHIIKHNNIPNGMLFIVMLNTALSLRGRRPKQSRPLITSD